MTVQVIHGKNLLPVLHANPLHLARAVRIRMLDVEKMDAFIKRSITGLKDLHPLFQEDRDPERVFKKGTKNSLMIREKFRERSEEIQLNAVMARQILDDIQTRLFKDLLEAKNIDVLPVLRNELCERFSDSPTPRIE